MPLEFRPEPVMIYKAELWTKLKNKVVDIDTKQQLV